MERKRTIASAIMRPILLSLMAGCALFNAAQAQVIQEWEARYNEESTVVGMGFDANNNIYIADAYRIIKYDPSGNQLATFDLGSPSTGGPIIGAMVVDSQGNIYIARASSPGLGIRKLCDGPYWGWVNQNLIGTPIDIKLDSNGDVVALFEAAGPSNPDPLYFHNYDYYVVKVFQNALIEVKEIRIEGIAPSTSGYRYNEKPEALAIGPDGDVYVTGTSGLGNYLSGGNYFTVRLNGATLTEKWRAYYNSPYLPGRPALSRGFAIAVDAQGNAYVTGMSGPGMGYYDIATLKYDPNGNQLWVVRFEGLGWDEGRKIGVDNFGNVWVTGQLGNEAGIGTFKYDQNGNELCKVVYSYVTPTNKSGDPRDLAIDPAGNVYIVGSCLGDGWDFVTIKYDNSCAEKWAVRYEGPGPDAPAGYNFDEPFRIGLDTNGIVYVSGMSPRASGEKDVTTIKYRQDQAVQQLADLVVSSLSCSPTIYAGRSISLSEATRNIGTVTTGASTVTKYYWSLNSNFDSGDAPLGQRTIAPLAPGATSGPENTTVTVPSGTLPGAYYIIAVADDGGVEAEISEGNNTKVLVVNVTGGPDLSISSFRGPASAPRGQIVTFAEATKNIGTTSAAASVTRYYLSLNNTFDMRDVPIGERSVPPLEAGATSYRGRLTISVPREAPLGTYYIIAVADADRVVAETLERNNMRALRVRVTQ